MKNPIPPSREYLIETLEEAIRRPSFNTMLGHGLTVITDRDAKALVSLLQSLQNLSEAFAEDGQEGEPVPTVIRNLLNTEQVTRLYFFTESIERSIIKIQPKIASDVWLHIREQLNSLENAINEYSVKSK